jgi:lipopolysaccharide transport system permease protein
MEMRTLDLALKTYHYRELILNFVIRDLKSRYKGSILGYLWTLLDPLLMMLIYIVIFSVIVRIKVESYPIFILTGILPWQFFSNSVSHSMLSLRENSNLMMKIYFPREVFPLSQVASGIIEFTISLLLLIPFLFIYHVTPSWRLLSLPLILIVQIAFVLGASLVLSILVAYLKDIKNVTTAVLRIWFYLTPILYPVSMVPAKYQFFFLLNPMTIVVSLYRWAILGSPIPEMGMVVMGALISLSIFMFGVWFFSINESDVIKRI